MTNEQLNTALYKKMFAEQEHFREWLLRQPAEVILHHAYEYAIHEDILMSFENNDLTSEQARALLKSSSPLADVYNQHEKHESSHMEEIWLAMESRANRVIRLNKPER